MHNENTNQCAKFIMQRLSFPVNLLQYCWALGVVDSLKNQGWTNEVNYEIAGVTVGDSNLISEAPRKGRENADRKVS